MLENSHERATSRERLKQTFRQLRAEQDEVLNRTEIRVMNAWEERKYHFINRLHWDTEERTPSGSALLKDEIYPTHLKPLDSKRNISVPVQPFISRVESMAKQAAIVNATFEIFPGKDEVLHSCCCLTALVEDLARYSNLCFSCTNRKMKNIFFCSPCFGKFSTSTKSPLDFLMLTNRQGFAAIELPLNCGGHKGITNAPFVWEQADEFTKLRPRRGLLTSSASTVVLNAAIDGNRLIELCKKELGRKVQPNLLFLRLLKKHQRQLMQSHEDMLVAQKSLSSAWRIVIMVASRTYAWKRATPSIIRKERFMRRSIYRMKMRTLAGAINSWIFYVSTIKRNRERVASSLRRILNRLLTASFNSWHLHTTRRVQARALARKVLARQLGMLKLLSFEAWQEYVDKVLQEKEEKVVSSLKKWKLLPAAMAMRAWWDFCLKMRRVRTFAQQMRMRGAARALRGWAAFVQRRIRTREFMRRQILRMQNRRVARLFDGWFLFLDMVLEEKEEKIRSVIERIQTRWQRQFFINLKTQTLQIKSVRRLQNWYRRVASLLELKVLQRARGEEEMQRSENRKAYIESAVNQAVAAAEYRYSKTLSGRSVFQGMVSKMAAFRRGDADRSTALQQQKESLAAEKLGLFSDKHVKHAIEVLDDGENVWKEMSNMEKIQHCRSVFELQVRPEADEIDKRYPLFEAAWRFVRQI